MGCGGREMKEEDAIASEGEAASPATNVLKRRNVAESNACEAEEVDEVLKLQQEVMKLQEEAMLRRKPTAAAEAAREAAVAAVLGGAYKKKRKIMKKRLSQQYIDYIMARPYKGGDEIPEETLAEHSQEFREWYATEKAISDKISQYEQAIINQYRTKGYAETLLEVVDDEDN